MTVLSHLQSRASNAVLSSQENGSIQTSITTLSHRLDLFFGFDIKEHFKFGSSTRGTILPRAMDGNSDIDYMIIFKNENLSPQTYLNYLKQFVNKYYSSSEIYQSNPTIVLELNHIKFDLVPAIERIFSGLQIPNGTTAWQTTNPNDFNKNLESKNVSENSLIKPTIRLLKFWNANNGYIYSSFELEKWIIGQNFWGCSNQKDYLFKVFDILSPYNENTQWKKDKIIRAKKIIENVRNYEINSMFQNAENEIKNLIP